MAAKSEAAAGGGHGLADMGFRCRLAEILGDWKWHQQCFGMRSTWLSDAMCHQCAATKS